MSPFLRAIFIVVTNIRTLIWFSFYIYQVTWVFYILLCSWWLPIKYHHTERIEKSTCQIDHGSMEAQGPSTIRPLYLQSSWFVLTPSAKLSLNKSLPRLQGDPTPFTVTLNWDHPFVIIEDEMVGWCHWLHGHEFEQALGVGDGQRSLVYCSPWGHKELDMAERLNWFVIIFCLFL